MNKPVDNALLTPTVGYWINNARVTGSSTRSGDVTNPATGTVTKRVSFANAKDIDTAMRLGLNFPRGPFEALARHGRETILAELARLRAIAPEPLKPRYDPAPGLETK